MEPIPAYEPKVFRKALVQMLVACNVPFAILEKPEFRRVFYICRNDVKFMGPRTAKEMVKDGSKDIMSKIQGRIGKSRFSITLDVWTSSSMDSYMGVIVHYIDNHWNYHESLIGFELLSGSHTGENLMSVLMSVLNLEYIALDTSKIVALTTDGASSNATMARHLTSHYTNLDPTRQHLHCMAHVLNIFCHIFFKTLKDPRRRASNTNGHNEEPEDEDPLLDELQDERYDPVDVFVTEAPEDVLVSLPAGFAGTVKKVCVLSSVKLRL